MLKKFLFCFLCMIVIPAYALLGPHLLHNCPSEYLLDLDLTFHNPPTTQQIGNELYDRNYIITITTYASIPAQYDERPTVPGPGSSFADGQWIWIPNVLNSEAGIWYWIIRPKFYYINLINTLLHPF